MSSTVNLKVEGQKLSLDKRVLHVEGTQGFYNVKLNLDSEWDDVDLKVVVFAYTPDYERNTFPKTSKMAVEAKGDTLPIPNQFLRKVGTIEVGLIGYSADDSIKVTTAPLEPSANKIRIVEAIAETTSVSPDPDTPDIWVQLQKDIGDLSDLETTDKSNLVAAINEIFNSEGSGVTREEVQEIADTAVAGEAALREAEDTELSNRISAEAATRQDAITSLSSQLTTEAAARTTADENLSGAISAETTARETADQNLQSQIDGISASSDVKDVVGTYAQLQAYDTSTLGDNDIVKVLQDENQNDETTYYRWSTTTETFTLIGEEGPYYTKSAADARFVPQARTVNNKALSSNIALDAADVGAVASSDVVQTTGAAADKIMSQAAVTGLVGDVETILRTLNSGTGAVNEESE